MGRPAGFEYEEEGGSAVLIRHHGRVVTTLRGVRAQKFLAEAAAGDPQLVMARWTGNYKHGNERMSRQHPRNRGRR
ncbi:hypothetical protein [Brevibacterium album]|uniref:hypothetical protein n=1 Tax=Brevibacterium album TaxID=417948 RepID=UPI000412C4BE|nr:hypothetical protein [Brevibacterium album]